MRATWIARVVELFVFVAAGTTCVAQTVVDADFSKGGFAALGWRANGDWDVFTYPEEAVNNPGAVARFAPISPMVP